MLKAGCMIERVLLLLVDLRHLLGKRASGSLYKFEPAVVVNIALISHLLLPDHL